MEHRIELGEIRLGKLGGPLALLGLAAAVFLAGGYYSGVLETFGYEAKRKTFGGFASGTESGTSVGLKYFPFLAGQKFFARYDVDVDRGSFKIVVLKTFGEFGNKPHHRHQVAADGSGEAVFTIEESGLYSIDFDGSVLGGEAGGSYDVSYTVTWGVRG